MTSHQSYAGKELPGDRVRVRVLPNADGSHSGGSGRTWVGFLLDASPGRRFRDVQLGGITRVEPRDHMFGLSWERLGIPSGRGGGSQSLRLLNSFDHLLNIQTSYEISKVTTVTLLEVHF